MLTSMKHSIDGGSFVEHFSWITVSHLGLQLTCLEGCVHLSVIPVYTKMQLYTHLHAYLSINI